jgi:GT2 family glycosyltransferase
VLYTDDDLELDPHWAERLVACFDDPLVMEAAGLVLPARLDKPAHWLAEMTAKHSRGIEHRVLDGAMVSPTRAPAAAVGASMAFRTNFLRSLGGFPEELGLGTPSRTGEDTWAAHRVLRAGYRIAYEPAAVSYHDPVDDIVELRKKVGGYGTGLGAYLLHTAWADRDPSAILGLVHWARYIVGKNVRAALRRPGAPTLALAGAELLGIFRAPLAYASARRRVRRLGRVLSRPVPPLDAPWLDRDEPDPSDEAEHLPGLSIVIPTRGRRDRVVGLVRALDDQEYPDDLVEIIVSVDGDIDGTARAAEEVAVRRRLRLVIEDQGGASAARNRGAAVASNEILVFLDDDVLPVDQSFFKAHARAHLRARSAVVGPCLPDLRDSRGFLAQRIRNWWIGHAGRLFRTSALDFADLSTGNFSLPRDIFFEFGGFLEMRTREDWEFGYRLSAAKFPLRAAPYAVVVQELEAGLDDVLAQQRDAGASDFSFAQRHPAALFRLPLGAWRDEGPEPPRLTRSWAGLGRRIGDVRLLSNRLVLRLLELAGVRSRFIKRFDEIVNASYWSGVAEASSGERAWLELIRIAEAGAQDALEFELGDDDRTPPSVNSPPDAVVTYNGVALGRVPLRCGGLPWDARQFAAEAIRRVGSPAI